MLTFGDAEIGGPTVVLSIPAAVDVVKTRRVLENVPSMANWSYVLSWLFKV